MAGPIQFYFEGDDFFTSIDEAVKGAVKSVDIEIYFLASDEVGKSLADLLVLKAKKGVCVRLIYDALGCRNISPSMLEGLKEAGVELKKFNSITPPGPQFRRRDHRKMVIVDGVTGFIGGFNFARDYSSTCVGDKAWRDTGCRITDSRLVMTLAFIFHHAWRGKIMHVRDYIRRRGKRPTFTADPLFILANYGWREKSLIREEYLSAIARAKKRVWLTTPYFVPDRGIRAALRRAAKRGIDVRLLVPGVTDVPIVSWAASSTYSPLMEGGVKIYEYQNRVLHAKCALVDDEWFTVGTANLDEMSFFSNLEVNLFGREVSYTRILADQFERDLAHALRIDPEEWKNRSWMAKVREKVSFYFRVWL